MASATTHNPLTTIRDTISNKEVTIDSGAQITLWPASPVERMRNQDTSFTIVAANGTKIPWYGKRAMTFQFGNRRYNWNVILAHVSRPLIGLDFLRQHKLMIDVVNNQLIQMDTLQAHHLKVIKSKSIQALHVSRVHTDPYTPILHSYPSLLSHDFRATEVKHGVQHYIETKGNPIHSKVRRINPAKAKSGQEAWFTEGVLTLALGKNTSPVDDDTTMSVVQQYPFVLFLLYLKSSLV